MKSFWSFRVYQFRQIRTVEMKMKTWICFFYFIEKIKETKHWFTDWTWCFQRTTPMSMQGRLRNFRQCTFFQTHPNRYKGDQTQHSAPNSQLCQSSSIGHCPIRKTCCPLNNHCKDYAKNCCHLEFRRTWTFLSSYSFFLTFFS